MTTSSPDLFQNDLLFDFMKNNDIEMMNNG